MTLSFDFLGWPEDGPTLRLDYREFAYAGKFVMSSTGKAVVREGEDVVAAAAFNEDRTDPDTLWIRYVTVRRDRQGEGIAPRLALFVRERAVDRGYDRVRIAVNNPFSYQALYRAGFGYTGEQTGIAELVCAAPPPDRSTERYQAGLDVFREREDLSEEERSFLADKRDADPPEAVA